jgi:hypothetical protein
MIAGGCLCGKVRFQSARPAISAGLCFCRDCQRVSGGGAAAVMVLDASGFAVSGETLRDYGSTSDSGVQVTRRFCGHCGTQLIAQNAAYPELLSIRAGTLDDPALFRPAFNLWLRSVQPWHAVDHNLACFDTQPQA